MADRLAERREPDVDDLHLAQHRLIKRHVHLRCQCCPSCLAAGTADGRGQMSR
jgi:hypothetical protein